MAPGLLKASEPFPLPLLLCSLLSTFLDTDMSYVFAGHLN